MRSLFARCPDNLADPLPGLFIHGARHPIFPGGTVRPNLLQHHPAQPGENGHGNNLQQHGFRIISHLAILVTLRAQGQSRRRFRAFRPAPISMTAACPAEYRVGRSGR